MDKRTSIMLHPAIEILAWAQAVSIAEGLFGKKAAAAVWAQSPLPQVVRVGARSRSSPGQSCFSILARWVPPGAAADVAALVVSAVNGDGESAERLAGVGIMLDLPGSFGFAAICTTHGSARSVWAGTPHALSWVHDLKTLPGVPSTTKKIRVGPGVSGRTHAVLVPSALFQAAAAPDDQEGGGGVPTGEVEDSAIADLTAGKWLSEALSGRFAAG